MLSSGNQSAAFRLASFRKEGALDPNRLGRLEAEQILSKVALLESQIADAEARYAEIYTEYEKAKTYYQGIEVMMENAAKSYTVERQKLQAQAQQAIAAAFESNQTIEQMRNLIKTADRKAQSSERDLQVLRSELADKQRTVEETVEALQELKTSFEHLMVENDTLCSTVQEYKDENRELQQEVEKLKKSLKQAQNDGIHKAAAAKKKLAEAEKAAQSAARLMAQVQEREALLGKKEIELLQMPEATTPAAVLNIDHDELITTRKPRASKQKSAASQEKSLNTITKSRRSSVKQVTEQQIDVSTEQRPSTKRKGPVESSGEKQARVPKDRVLGKSIGKRDEIPSEKKPRSTRILARITEGTPESRVPAAPSVSDTVRRSARLTKQPRLDA